MNTRAENEQLNRLVRKTESIYQGRLEEIDNWSDF
jgi:hypothetical protein